MLLGPLRSSCLIDIYRSINFLLDNKNIRTYYVIRSRTKKKYLSYIVLLTRIFSLLYYRVSF